MHKIFVAVCVFCLVFAVTAEAIDRDARMIDRAQLDLASLDNADSIGASIWGETALAAPGGEWAFLGGLGFGTISPDDAANDDYWGLALGLKYYFTELTSVSVLGSYVNLDNGSDRDIKAGGAQLKHRFVSATEPVCPFLKAGVTYRRRSTFSDWEVSDDSVSETAVDLGGGLELAMNETFSFVIEASYVNAESSDDDASDPDGWLGAISMQYYWF